MTAADAPAIAAPPAAVTRAWRVAEVEARRYRRTWRGSVVSSFLTPLLYLGAMGLGLGTLVDRGSGAAALGEVSYAAWLAPGMLAASAMQTGAMEGAWPVMAGIKWRRTYHAALATPVAIGDLVLGNSLWVTARLAMASVAFALVVALLGLAPVGGILLAIVPAVLTGLAFGLPMTAFTPTVRHQAHLATVFRFGVVPMFLLSGTFFPVSQLPGPVAAVAAVLPLYHGIELARGAALGIPPALPVAVHLVVLAAWIGVGGLLARWSFDRRLRP